MCCVSPVIGAAVLQDSVEVTVGSSITNDDWPYAGTAIAINNYGGKHVDVCSKGVHVDQAKKVVTSPAYMFKGTPFDIYHSVGQMVKETLRLL